MNKLEAQALIEATGNYDECEEEDILEIYEDVCRHIGFEDRRRDSRFIVKFHDIFYYMPDDMEKEYYDTINCIFDSFCWDQYALLKEDLKEMNIDVEDMLTRHTVGNYQAFKIDISNITKENAAEIAMNIYDEFGYHGASYASDYVYVVEALQNMEDYYMDNWIEFLRCGEYFTEEKIKEIEDMYEADKERRQAAQTLAK